MSFFARKPSIPSGNNADSPLNCEPLEPRVMLSSVEIVAAGTTNQEQLELLIDNEVVEVFNNVGGDAYGNQFISLNYSTAENITADQVRLRFTNDLYDQANNIDRNVRVDAIVIDGVRFETESPDVFSTGTWLPADGVQPGFRESEFLQANGYFQYAGGNNDGSLIEVRALGQEGVERFELQIAGQTVQEFTTTTLYQTFQYRAAEDVTADQVRIVFTNDAYDPANNIDNNLQVNFIEVDGQRFQTEAPTVYSTGSWLAADGIQPGFRESEVLHTNGYFQYNAQPTGNPGSIGLSNNVISVNEGAGSRGIVIFRANGSDGRVSVNYSTRAGTATAADYTPVSGTAVFEDGETDMVISIDINDDSQVEPNEDFFFEIDSPTGGATLGGITSQRVTIVNNDGNQSGIIFEDSFEGANNWTVNPNGTDTAVRGLWEVGAPQETVAGNFRVQIGSGNTGSRALVTGLAAGSSVGAFDVDNGTTSVQSPEISLPSGISSELRFAYNFAHTSSADGPDNLVLNIVAENGELTSIFSTNGDRSERAGFYRDVAVSLNDFAGQTIQLLFSATDSTGTIIEAAIDDVVVESLAANAGTVNIVSTLVNVNEDAGSATINLERTGGRDGIVTVNYQTVLGTAGSSDFVLANGTVTFQDQQSTASISIGILDDSSVENIETFRVQLSDAAGGLTIGSQSVATVTIVDDDASENGDFLPDLVAIEDRLSDNLYVDRNQIAGRKLMRFSTEVANAGDGPLEIWGGDTSGNTQEVFQRIYGENGSRDQLAGEFVYHESHGHIHFEGFANYNLLDLTTEEIIATGGKTSFCLINITQPFPEITAAADLVNGRGGNSCGQFQGISTGYADVYSAGLPDQWIDITNVANGTYWLEMTSDPDNVIQEKDETNNSARIQVRINGDSVTAL